MTCSQWGKLTLSLIIGALMLIVSSVILIDPFEVYHKATAFIPPIESGTQSYSNAGIAKSYDYDSIIIGSSMTENFRPSQLDQLLGGRFVKLCINGGTPFNHKQMMDIAFATHDVKRVLYGLDISGLTFFYRTPKAEMPTYLYDDNLFNDVSYWFNKSVLLKYIPQCLKTLGQTDPNLRDTMYNWGDLYEYGKEAALRNLTITGEIVAQDPIADTPTPSQQTLLNIEHNLLPYIQAHPETEFLFFFPPYAVARWLIFYQQGTLQYHLNQKEAIADALLGYENVKVYDFTARTDWITNLDYYIDDGHYAPSINDAMAVCISRDEFRVTSAEQVKSNNAVIRSLVEQVVACGAWPDTFRLP